MFDDHPGTNQSSPPSNLPMGEPQDIFASTEKGTEAPFAIPEKEIPPFDAEVSQTVNSEPPLDPSSALGAGVLKPKVPSASVGESPLIPPAQVLRPLPPSVENAQPSLPSENTIKEPTLGRGIMIAIMVIVIVLILGGSGWFVYKIFNKNSSNTINSNNTVVPFVETTSTPAEPLVPLEESPVTSSASVDESILLGEPMDTDTDGLDDTREDEMGTDKNNWDSDNDGLSDGEEVLIWHTNPKNSDTDADSYTDGMEIKSGYNPAGPGRLSELKTSSSTPSSLTTTTPSSNAPSVSSSSSTKVTSTTSSFEIEL